MPSTSASDSVCRLVAVATQRGANALGFRLIDDGRAAEVALALLAHPGGQVARSARTMLHLAGSRDAKAFLSALVRFLLRHDPSQIFRPRRIVQRGVTLL